MPNDKDKKGTELKAFADTLSQKAAVLDTVQSDNEKVKKAKEGILKLSGILNQSIHNMQGLEPDASTQFCAALKDYGDAMEDFVVWSGLHFDELSETEREFYDNAVGFAGFLRENDDKLVDVRDTLEITSRFKSIPGDTLKQMMPAQFKRTGATGHRPTLEECRTLSIENSDPETVFDRMLWLHDQQNTLQQAGVYQQDSVPGFYQQTLSRLHEELETASPATQAKYAALFLCHDVMIKGLANKAKKTYIDPPGSKKVDKRGLLKEDKRTQKEREYDGNSKLCTDPAFLNAVSYEAFLDSFRNTRMADTLAHLEMGKNGAPLLAPNIQQARTDINGLIHGGMETFLKENHLTEQVRQANLGTMEQKAQKLDTKPKSVVSRIGNLYTEFMNVKGKISLSFKAMQESLAAVASMDHTNSKTRGAYIAALAKAQDMARIYMDSHQSYRFTDSGKERVQMAKRMETLMKRQMETQITLQTEEDQKTLSGMAKTLSFYNRHEDLRKIAKVRKHIAPVRIIPREPKFSAEITPQQELKGDIKHKLFTFGHGVMGGLDWGAQKITEKVKPVTNKRVETELDLDKIPGRNGEKFPEYNPDDPKNGGPNQEIIADSRRTPLTWEQLIPENPDQPPTITFEFDQGREGDPTAYPIVVKNGKKDNEMGHGFVTLQYTKNNPFSGKPERYKVSFGFYPKGGFLGMNIMTAQTAKGMSVPGQLNEDNDHEASTGLTYTVTNQQINKVILAAQHYEKDGYNYFDRNCTTFVKDMGDAAGIDLSHVLKEVDLTSEGQNLKYAGMLAGGAGFLSYLGKRDILSKTGRADDSYQRFGQKMLNKEDVVRVENAMEVFNKRMKGYTPGHATESVRNAKGFKLHSSKYDFKIRVAKNKEEKISWSEKTVFLEETKLRQEFGNLCASIIKRGELDGLKATEMEPAINHMSEYMDNMITSVSEYAKRGFLGYSGESPDNGTRLNWAEQKQALVDGTEALNEMIEGFNEIYQNTFKGDAELNIPFQHMVSMITHFKSDFAEKYRDVNDELLYTKNNEKNPRIMESINSEVDKSRDTYQALRSYRCGVFKMEKDGVQGPERNGAEIAAMIQTYGSYEEGEKTLARREELKGIKGKTPEQTKELDAIDRRYKTYNAFVAAQKSYFENREFTVGDYTFAFVELPLGLKGYIPDQPGGSPSRIYQAVAMEKIFGGTKKVFDDVLDEAEEQIDELDEENEKRLERKRTKILKDKIAEGREKVLRHLAAKMTEKNGQFRMLAGVCLERSKFQTPLDPDKTKEENNMEMANRAEKFLTRSILKNYLKPLTEDILKDRKGMLPENLTFDSLFSEKDLIKMPEFRKMQKELDAKLGIERPDPIEQKKLAAEKENLEQNEPVEKEDSAPALGF